MIRSADAILARMKRHDDHNIGVVTLLANEPTLSKLIASWPNVARRLVPDENPSESAPDGLPVTEYERWMWSRVEPELEPLWAEVSGLPDAPHIRRAMRVLQDNGAVFPDGKMSKWSERWLAESAKRAGVKREEESISP